MFKANKRAVDLQFIWETFKVKSYHSLVSHRLKHLPGMQETGVRSLSREDPLEKEMATHSSNLGASPVAQMVKNLPEVQEIWVRSPGWEDLLEKGMATHQYSCLGNPMDIEA